MLLQSEPKIGWSGAVSGRCTKTMERSEAWEVAERGQWHTWVRVRVTD